MLRGRNTVTKKLMRSPSKTTPSLNTWSETAVSIHEETNECQSIAGSCVDEAKIAQKNMVSLQLDIQQSEQCAELYPPKRRTCRTELKYFWIASNGRSSRDSSTKDIASSRYSGM